MSRCRGASWGVTVPREVQGKKGGGGSRTACEIPSRPSRVWGGAAASGAEARGPAGTAQERRLRGPASKAGAPPHSKPHARTTRRVSTETPVQFLPGPYFCRSA